MSSFVKLKQQLVFITAGIREEQNLLYICLIFTMAKVNSKEFEALLSWQVPLQQEPLQEQQRGAGHHLRGDEKVVVGGGKRRVE